MNTFAKVQASALLIGLAVLFLLLAVAPFVATAADDEKPALEVRPTAIKVYPDRQTPLAIVMRNPTGKPIREVKLTCLSDANVNLDCSGLTLKTLDPLNDYSWNPKVTFKPNEQYGPGTLTFIAEYLDANGSKRIVSASVEVQNGAPESVDQVAEMKTESSLETLTGQNNGRVFVVVTNKTNEPMDVTVKPTWPEFIEAADGKTEYSVNLTGHETKSVPIDVKATRRVRPGKRLILFNVVLQWRRQPATDRTQGVDAGC